MKAIERFTTCIVKTAGGPRETAGYFPDAASATLYARALLHTHYAISARVLRLRWLERPGVARVQYVYDVDGADTHDTDVAAGDPDRYNLG